MDSLWVGKFGVWTPVKAKDLVTRPDLPWCQPTFCTTDKGALETGLRRTWSDLDHSPYLFLRLRVRRTIPLPTPLPVYAFASFYGVTFNVANYKVFQYVIFSVLCYSTSSSVQHISKGFLLELTLISNFHAPDYKFYSLILNNSVSVRYKRPTRHCRLLISFIAFVFYLIQRTSELPHCACS